ncbi:MAG: hypothetical protein EXR71_14570 [Myxococcales bacterium]|nr:hypothetical protein [Myxococcales bacterium]
MPGIWEPGTRGADAMYLDPECLVRGTMPWLLATRGGELFSAWLAIGWRGSGRRGRKAWPARVLMTLCGTGVPAHLVVTVVPVDGVVPRPTVDDVIVGARDRGGPGLAKNLIVSFFAVDGVEPGAAGEGVGRVRAVVDAEAP